MAQPCPKRARTAAASPSRADAHCGGDDLDDDKHREHQDDEP